MNRNSLGLVVIDPYNDFLSFGGKSWLLTRRTMRGGEVIENMRRAIDTCRRRNHPVFYAPDARHRGDTYDHQCHPNPSIMLADTTRSFRAGSRGGRFRNGLQPTDDDFVATEHLTSSGFVGTNLEELLRDQDVTRIAVCGCLSNTCVESTVRSGIDLGFEVVVLIDALVAMSPQDHDAAKSSFRTIAHEVVHTQEFFAH